MKPSSILRILILAVLLPYSLSLSANDDILRRARSKAAEFVAAHSKNYSRSVTTSPSQLRLIATGEEIAPYVFNYDECGFVMVAADHEHARVVAYGECPTDSLPAAVKWWRTLAASATIPTPTITPAEPTTGIAPLLSSQRHQTDPFNRQCPFYLQNGISSTTRTKVGCVATALEQIISYHRRPASLMKKLVGWTTDNYTINSIPAGTRIDYDHILNIYRDGAYSDLEADAVAALSYYCGVAAHMTYGISESGARLSSLVTPLKQAFGYAYVRHLYASNYSPLRWRHLIDEELQAARPVLYAGYTSLMQGHAFVVDGRDEEGFYHINWGYGGLYDGYYDLSVLNTFENPQRPTKEGRWLGNFCLQEMIVLGPDAVDYRVDDDLKGSLPRLSIDSVVYSRPADTNGYLTVDIYAENLWNDSVTAAVELLTFKLGEPQPFDNGDYIAITSLQLAPHAHGRMRAYCKFHQTGQRVMGISEDGETFLSLDTLQILEGHQAGVSITAIDTFSLENNELCFVVSLHNNSSDEWAGQMITYSLFEGQYTTDGGEWRQWRVLNLPPGEALTDTVSFGALRTGCDYEMVVRNPWLPALTLQFRLPIPTDGIPPLLPETETGLPMRYYDLNGRRLSAPPHQGIYLEQRGTIVRKRIHLIK